VTLRVFICIIFIFIALCTCAIVICRPMTYFLTYLLKRVATLFCRISGTCLLAVVTPDFYVTVYNCTQACKKNERHKFIERNNFSKSCTINTGLHQQLISTIQRNDIVILLHSCTLRIYMIYNLLQLQICYLSL